MEIKQAVAALTALSQESRLGIFRLLVPRGEAGLAVGEIAEELDIPGATLTFHLKELLHAGLVESRREGRSIRYSLKISGMRELLTFLTEDCCEGRPELCGPSCCDETPTIKRKAAEKKKRASR